MPTWREIIAVSHLTRVILTVHLFRIATPVVSVWLPVELVYMKTRLRSYSVALKGRLSGPSRVRLPSRIPALQLPSTSRNQKRALSVFSIFNRHSPSTFTQAPSLANAHRNWTAALNAGRIPQIQQSYTLLLQWTAASPPSEATTASLPSDNDILRMLDLISNSPNPDISFLNNIISNYSTTLHRPLTLPHYEAVVRTFVNAGLYDEAFAWLDKGVQAAATSGITLTSGMWDSIMEGYINSARTPRLDDIFAHMESHGVVPSLSSYRLHIRSLTRALDKPGTHEELDRVLGELEREGLQGDPAIRAQLLAAYSAVGMTERAEEVAESIRRALGEDLGVAQAENNSVSTMLDTLVKYERTTHGDEATVALLSQLKERGYQPSSKTIAAILQARGPDVTADDLREVAAELGTDAGADAWAILIDHALSKNDFETASSIYSDALTSLRPSITLARGLFATRHYRLDAYRTLMDVYHDLQTSDPPMSDGDALQMYEDLFLSLTRWGDRQLGPITLGLLVDMKNRSLTFDTGAFRRILAPLMESARSYSQAHAIYTNFRALGKKVASQDDFKHVLLTFINMRLPRGSQPNFPPAPLVFSIAKDMTDDGFDVESDVFTYYFRRLRTSALDMQYRNINSPASNPNHDLLLNIRRAHALFRMYAAVTPDARFLNLLMDVYSRTGGFAEVLSIWEDELVSANMFDDRSIAIVLDTCGHYGSKETAFAIWSFILNRERRGFQITPKIWETWIECLCRLNLAEEVRKTLVEELGTPVSERGAKIPPGRTFINDTIARRALNFQWRSKAEEKRVLIVAALSSLPGFTFPDSTSPVVTQLTKEPIVD